MTRWLVVEHQSEIEELTDPLEDTTVLALSPAVMTTCRERAIPVVGVERYIDTDQLNALAEANFGHVQAATASLSEAWASMTPAAVEGFDPFRAGAYVLKRVADAVTFRLTELVAFLDAERPVEVGVPAPRAGTAGRDGLPLEANVELASNLLLRLERVRVLELGRHPRTGGGHGQPRRPRGPSFNRNILSLARFRLARWLGPFLRQNGGRITVGAGEDHVRAFAAWAWRQHAASPDWWVHWDQPPARGWVRVLRKQERIEVPAVSLSELERVANTLRGQPLWGVGEESAARDMIVDRLQSYISDIPRLLRLYLRARAYFHASGSRALVTGQTSAPELLTISQAAHSAGVPHVVFQHGGCYGYCRLPTLNWSDLTAATIFGTWGTGVGDDLRKQLGANGTGPVFVNSGWAAPRRRVPSSARSAAEQPALLYVTTGLHGNLRYGPDHSPLDNEYVDLQERVAAALVEAGLGRVVVKLHYKDKSANPLRRRLRHVPADKLEVRQDGPFVELLPTADAVIVDYASTTLLQAMAAGKPVVLVDQGVHRYSDAGKRALMAAVRWVGYHGADWPERLVREVARALAEGPLPGAEDFLRAYGDPSFRPERIWEAILAYERPEHS